jgi:hypothetical protein
MAKRGRPPKKQKLEDEGPSMTLPCFINTTAMHMLRINKQLPLSIFANKLNKQTQQSNLLTCTYSKTKGREWDEWIADEFSPARMTRGMRSVLCADNNVQIDMYSAASTYATHLANKYELDLPRLREYHSQRDRGFMRDLLINSQLTEDEVKKWVSSSLIGSTFMPDNISEFTRTFLSQLKAEFLLIHSKCVDDLEFKPIHSYVMTSDNGAPPPNSTTKFMSAVFRSIQARYITAAMLTVAEQGFTVSGIIGDAFMVNKTGSSGDLSDDATMHSFLVTTQNYIHMHLDGLVPILRHKSLRVSDEEEAFLTEPFNTFSVVDADSCCGAINIMFNKKLRDQNGSLFVKVPGVPGAYIADDNSIEYYINQHLIHSPFLNTARGHSRAVEFASTLNSRWFHNFFDHRDTLIAFKNGVYDMETLEFRDLRVGEFTRIFYKQDYHARLVEEETPYWQKLVGAQWDDDEYIEFAEAMMGRTLYPLLYDRWEKMLFIGGHSQSGKSTMLEVLMECHAKGTVSVMSAGSTSFSLADHLGKQAAFCMDIPSSLDGMLERSTWLSMISGETIKVNIKFKKGRDVRWQTHLVWAGNYAPRYKDAAASSERRMVILECNNPVKEVDTKLKEKIVENELAILHLRFIQRYRLLKDKVGNDSLDQHTPPQIMQIREEVSYCNNALKAFIEVGSKRSVVERVDDENYITLREFNDAFSKFQKFGFDGGNKEKYHIEQAHSSSFAPFNIRWRKTHQCKVCQAIPPTSNSCGDHWKNGANRTTCIVLHGIKIRMTDANGVESLPGQNGQIWHNN